MTLRRKLFGNRAFYAMVLAVSVPIMVQNGITSFVGLLDNVMVGRVGTEQMSGVAIANQLLFVYNLSIFGALSGAGIFTSQFYGSSQIDGVRSSFRLKLYIAFGITLAGLAIFLLWGKELIYMFLQGTGDVGDIDATAAYGMSYLKVMLPGLLPFAITQVYAGTLKETGKTVLPMAASITAVLVNLLLNYILIFGKLGAPVLGVDGAAIATVISRFAELSIIVVGTHAGKAKYEFIRGIYSTMKIPLALTGKILAKGLPLLANELLWSSGMAILNQCYSLRGLSVVAAVNISSTIANLFSVVMMALGNSVAIIVGQQLGAGNIEKAKDTDTKLICFSVLASAVVGLLFAASSPFIPRIYNTETAVRSLATSFMLISAAVMPLNAFALTAYFTLRSGGKTLITFLFDCVYSWVLMLPLAFVLTRFTNMDIISVYLIVQLSNIIKCAIGLALVKKGIWAQNIVKA